MVRHVAPHDQARADAAALALYRQMYRHGSPTVEDAATALELPPEDAALGRAELHRLGLIQRRDGEPMVTVAVPPERAILRVLARGQDRTSAYRTAIEETAQTLERLVEHFLPMGPGELREIEMRVVTDPHRVALLLDNIADLARTEMCSMHPGPLPPAQLLLEGRERDYAMSRRGLRLRTIYVQRLTSVGYVLDYLRDLASFGYEIRVAPVIPVRMLICDGLRAVLPLNPENGREGAIVIDGDVFVRSLMAIFEFCWHASSAFDELPAGGGATATLTDQELTVLRMLAAGRKDERIARDIGVSVRTVSRMIRDIMQRVGAESRFQAGVRAARLGWVD